MCLALVDPPLNRLVVPEQSEQRLGLNAEIQLDVTQRRAVLVLREIAADVGEVSPGEVGDVRAASGLTRRAR
jgi:hypothetical protein